MPLSIRAEFLAWRLVSVYQSGWMLWHDTVMLSIANLPICWCRCARDGSEAEGTTLYVHGVVVQGERCT